MHSSTDAIAPPHTNFILLEQPVLFSLSSFSFFWKILERIRIRKTTEWKKTKQMNAKENHCERPEILWYSFSIEWPNNLMNCLIVAHKRPMRNQNAYIITQKQKHIYTIFSSPSLTLSAKLVQCKNHYFHQAKTGKFKRNKINEKTKNNPYISCTTKNF